MNTVSQSRSKEEYYYFKSSDDLSPGYYRRRMTAYFISSLYGRYMFYRRRCRRVTTMVNQ